MIVRLRDLLEGLRALKIGDCPVIVHASLSSLGQVEGGAQMVVAALLETFPVVIAPTFTYKTMVVPLTGPEKNGITYGAQADQNRTAEFYDPQMPADRMMGVIPEALRQHPLAKRSAHPILSFTGVNADSILRAQHMGDPLAPIGSLQKLNGWVLLLGVDHTTNTSIHYAERLAGRKQFLRWALTTRGVRECPGFPGCSAGFQAISPALEQFTRRGTIGNAAVQAVLIKMLCIAVVTRIKKDPLALLCQREDCERCGEIRRS